MAAPASAPYTVQVSDPASRDDIGVIRTAAALYIRRHSAATQEAKECPAARGTQCHRKKNAGGFATAGVFEFYGIGVTGRQPQSAQVDSVSRPCEPETVARIH